MYLPSVIAENQSKIRRLRVEGHKVSFKRATWRPLVRDFDEDIEGLPKTSISRGQIAERFVALAPDSPTCNAAEELRKLLIWTVLWAYGPDDFVHDQQHIPKMLATPGLGVILCQASQQCHYGMHLSAFRHLNSRIVGLGPATASRFLYFLCWHSEIPVRPLIFDSKIISSLRKLDWPGWCPEYFRAIKKPQSYGQYLVLIHNWAAAIRCKPDQLEYFLLRGLE